MSFFFVTTDFEYKPLCPWPNVTASELCKLGHEVIFWNGPSAIQ